MKSGAVPFLASKIRPPRAARGVVARPRLDALLQWARHRQVTLIKAPPGFGKTTLAVSWADQLTTVGAKVAWLSLGPEDDDGERFLHCIDVAIQRGLGGEDTPEAPGADLSIPIEHRVEWLIDRLVAQPEEIFLFLDDFHLIDAEEIHRGIALLLRRAPETLHLVCIGRQQPKLDLGWLRAHDAVFEVDASLLRFDLDETRLLLRRGGETPHAAEMAPTLHAWTGGWIAALRTALLTLRVQADPAQYLQRLPGALRSINQLFADLLRHLPHETAWFMQVISITERQCSALADCLTGAGDGQSMLEALERQQLFFGAQDDEGAWFAFHPLFREFLQRSARENSAQRMQETHLKAAHWFADHGHWTEAIRHALEADAIDFALRLIESHAMSVVGAGDLITLLAWERQLRSHLVASPLRLRLAFAWGLALAMASDKALRLLDGVEAELGDDAAVDSGLRRECQALRSVIVCSTGDHETAERLAEECIANLPPQPWVLTAVRNVIASADLHHGRWHALYGTPPLPGGGHGQRGGDRLARTYQLSIRGLAEYRQGHLDEAALLLSEAMQQGAGARVRGSVLATIPAPTLALIRYEQGRLEEAASINARHMDGCRRVAPIEGLYAAYQVAARIARLDGHAARARHLLDEGESIGAARGWRRVEVAMLLEKTRFCLLDGRAMEAAACGQRIEALAARAKDRYTLEHADFNQAACLARAWCDLAEGRHERAADTLAALGESALGAGKRLEQIQAETGHALALLGLGETGAAREVFAAACRRAHEIGAQRAIIDQPLPIDALLAALREDALALARDPWLGWFLDTLERARRDTAPAPAAEPATGSAIELLSPRERNVLKLMASGHSNKEIARGLGITPETVKSHAKNIYVKLGAQNRAQAVARAGLA